MTVTIMDVSPRQDRLGFVGGTFYWRRPRRGDQQRNPQRSWPTTVG
jgi:hypothetical protein